MTEQISYIRTDDDLAARRDDRPFPDHHPAQDRLRDRRRHRRHRLGIHRVRPRRDGERGLVRGRGDLHLHHRIPVLRPADRDEGRAPARRPRHAGRNPRRRHRLCADRPAGAVRPPFRRDRGGRTTRRSGAGHPDGLSALQHLDHLRRGVRRGRAGLPGLWISTRRRGRSLGQMARDEIGAIGGAAPSSGPSSSW